MLPTFVGFSLRRAFGEQARSQAGLAAIIFLSFPRLAIRSLMDQLDIILTTYHDFR